MSKFAVVEFLEENFYAVVSRDWCELEKGSQKGECFWPHFGGQEKAKQLVEPDKKKWRKYPIRVFRYAEDYGEAEVLMTMARVTYHLDGDHWDAYKMTNSSEMKESTQVSSSWNDIGENGGSQNALVSFLSNNHTFQQKVLTELKTLKTMVGSLLRGSAPTNEEDVLPSPITSVPDLEIFDARLKEREFRDKTVRQLSSIGGKGLPGCTKRILRTIATRDVWAFYSLKGKKGKRSFEKLAVCGVVIKACQSNNSEWRRKAIEDSIAEILKYSPRRRLKKPDGGPSVEKE